jgi:hypothetical protein
MGVPPTVRPRRLPILGALALVLATSVRAQVPAVPPLPAGSNECDVTVVDAETGRPLGGVEVQWNDDRVPFWPVLDLEEPVHMPPNARPEPFRRRARTDNAGRVHIGFGMQTLVLVQEPAGNGSLFVAVRDGDPPLDEPRRLVVEPLVPWPVLVLDALGQPLAKARVDLELVEGSKGVLVASLPTDERGATTLPCPKALLRAAGEPPQVRITAKLGRHSGEPWQGPVDTLTDPLVLVVGNAGRIDVHVDVPGRPAGAQVEVLLRNERGLESFGSFVCDESGAATIASVPLQVPFLLRCRLEALLLERELPAFQRAGERAEVHFALDHAPTTLSLQLVGPNGVAVPSLVQVVARGANATWNTTLPVRADGALCWRLGDGLPVGTGLDTLVVSCRLRNGVTWSGELRPGKVAAGDNDLGRLELVPPPLLLRARVRIDAEPCLPPTGFTIEFLPPPAASQPEAQWTALRGCPLEARWGGIVAWGGVPGMRHRLRFTSAGHEELAPVEFEPGTDGLEIDLHTTTSLVVSLLLPDELEVDAVRAVLLPERGGALEERAWPGTVLQARSRGAAADVAPVARVRWPDVPRGRYRLQLGPAGWPEPALELRDVELPLPGDGDPRLASLDLRPHVRFVRVRVQRPPLASDEPDLAVVFVDPFAQPAAEWVGFPVQAGVARVALPKRPVDLLVGATGCRPGSLQRVRSDCAVELQPWPRAQLEFVGLPPLPDDVELKVSGLLAEAPQHPGVFRAGPHRDRLERLLEDRAVARANAAGLVWVPAQARPAEFGVWLIGPGHLVPLQRLSTNQLPAGPGRVRVQLDADEVSAALAELAAQRPREVR